MTQKTSPFLDVKWGWDLGESGWNGGMDENLTKFSFLFDKNIDDIVPTLPSPVNGKAYFLTTDNRLYYVVGGTYYSSPTPINFTVIVKNTGQHYIFNGTSLVAVASNEELSSEVSDIQTTISTLGSAAFQPSSNFVITADQSNTTDPLKGSALVGRGFQVVNTVAEAVLLSKNSPSKNVFILGYSVAGDGGGGPHIIKTTGVANGGTVHAMNDGGFLHLCQSSPPTLKQWGCKGDGVTDDTARFLACVSSGLDFHIPKGDFLVSPIGPPATPPYPGTPLPGEPDRTSAARPVSGQKITGQGSGSILRWGSAQKQAFFCVQDGKHIDISGVHFIGGYTALVLDPTSDGSVEDCGLTDCYLEGQIIGMIGGRQLALDPTGSKTCLSPYMRGCRVESMSYHGCVMTNCYQPRVIGCTYKNITGFACDFSQGTHGGIMSECSGENVTYVAKVESTNVAGGDANKLESSRNIFNCLNFRNISKLAILANSAADDLIISNCEFDGSSSTFSDSLIWIDAASVIANPGRAIISNCILRMPVGGCIHHGLNSGTLPTLVVGCQLYGGGFAIEMLSSKLHLVDCVISADAASGNCINTGVGNFSGLDGFHMSGCLLTGNNGIVEQGTTNTWKRISIINNTFNISNFAVYSATATSLAVFRFQGNTVNRLASSSQTAVSVPTTAAASVSNNIFNINTTGAGKAFGNATSIGKSVVSGNISTVALALTGQDTETTTNTVNNITNAVFLA